MRPDAVCVPIASWGDAADGRHGARRPDSRRGRPVRQSGRIVAVAADDDVRAPACVCSLTYDETGGRSLERCAVRICGERLVVEGLELVGERRGDAWEDVVATRNPRAGSRQCSPTRRRRLLLRTLYIRHRGCPTRLGRQTSLLPLRKVNIAPSLSNGLR